MVICFPLVALSEVAGAGWGGGGTLYNGITVQAPPERGYLFHASGI